MSKARFPVANRVKELRELNGQITQTQLGEEVGVTRQTIAAIEQRRYSPSLEVAFKIARFFNTGIEKVFYWHDQ